MPLKTLHTSSLFDSKKKKFVKDISVTVDTETGLITKVISRNDATPLPKVVPEGDVDLRGKFVMPGFVDAHTHIFLHSYE
jgi:imidazolonepropionase-like amidohydrolase